MAAGEQFKGSSRTGWGSPLWHVAGSWYGCRWTVQGLHRGAGRIVSALECHRAVVQGVQWGLAIREEGAVGRRQLPPQEEFGIVMKGVLCCIESEFQHLRQNPQCLCPDGECPIVKLTRDVTLQCKLPAMMCTMESWEHAHLEGSQATPAWSSWICWMAGGDHHCS